LDRIELKKNIENELEKRDSGPERTQNLLKLEELKSEVEILKKDQDL
jgi:hypothetical protein